MGLPFDNHEIATDVSPDVRALAEWIDKSNRAGLTTVERTLRGASGDMALVDQTLVESRLFEHASALVPDEVARWRAIGDACQAVLEAVETQALVQPSALPQDTVGALSIGWVVRLDRQRWVRNYRGDLLPPVGAQAQIMHRTVIVTQIQICPFGQIQGADAFVFSKPAGSGKRLSKELLMDAGFVEIAAGNFSP